MNTGEVHWIAFTVFLSLFLLVTVLGFLAARWKAGDMNRLDEGGLIREMPVLGRPLPAVAQVQQKLAQAGDERAASA